MSLLVSGQECGGTQVLLNEYLELFGSLVAENQYGVRASAQMSIRIQARRSTSSGMLSIAGMLSLILAIPLQATPIFNNLGLEDAYCQYTGRTVGRGTAYPGGVVTASAFTPAFSEMFGTLEIALGYVTGSGEADIALAAGAGALPGSVIEQFHVTSLGRFGSDHIIVAESVIKPRLLAGQQYWIMVSAPHAADWMVWNDSLGDTGPVTQRLGSAAWFYPSNATRGAFRISPAMVPEPSLLPILSLVLLCTVLRLNRTSRGERLAAPRSSSSGSESDA